MRKLFLSSGAVMAARISGAGLGFVTQIILARTLSPEELGTFFLASSIATVAGTAAALGYPNAIPVLFARYQERGIHMLAAALARYTRRQAAGVAAAMMVIVVFVGLVPFFASAGVAVAAAAFSIPAIGLMKVNGALATGARRFNIAFFPELLFRPFGFLIVLLVMIDLGLAISAVTLGLAASLVASIVAAHQWRSVDVTTGAPVHRRLPARLVRAWRAIAWPLFIVGLFAALFADVSIVLAGLVLSKEEMAAFGICIKLAFMIGFAVQLAHQIATPDLAASHARRESGAAASFLRQANIFAVVVTFAALVVCIAVGDHILALFGPDYQAAKGALIILAAAQFGRACFGPNIQLMTIAGLQRRMGVVFGMAVAVLAAANLILVPPFGINGAAGAVALTTLFWVVALALLLYARSGIRADVFA